MGSPDRRQKLEAAGLCNKCGKAEPKEGRKKCEACLRYFVEWNAKHVDRVKPKQKEYRHKIKCEVLEKYGGKCECCQEARVEFLAIDHKNNDGNVERRALYGRNQNSTYSWFLKLRREEIREDLRVLCHNCNMAIAIYGKCPHQSCEQKAGVIT